MGAAASSSAPSAVGWPDVHPRHPARRVRRGARGPPRRAGSIAEWLRDWARRSEDFNHNLIALGDFNIDREGDPNFDAFTSTGLRAPSELDAAPRTISDPDGGGAFYDQLAWFHEDSHARLTLHYTGQAGHFPWTDHYRQDVPNQQRSWRMSDHYPLWAEFSVRGH
jgi:endonuclease/exonuclease/phosphatase family metal-dependent hydrolase